MNNFVTPFVILVLASLLSRFSYQMARSPVLPRFAQDLGSSPELIGLIVAASTITGIFIKLPAGALSDLLGRRRMMLLGSIFFALPPFLYTLITDAPSLLMLIRLFQQDTTYSVWACHGRRFPEACVNFSVSSPAKRPVRNIWRLAVGLTGLSVRSAGTSVRMS
jgi:MFS family permease